MGAGERILVIGGTRGTGLEIVRRLAREGHSVRALARDPVRAREWLDPAVEVVAGDITKPATLPGAVAGAAHVFFTVGVTGGFAGEAQVRATIFDGLQNTLAALRDTGFVGRFLYMTTVGVTTPSPAGLFLDVVKRNTLRWRRRAEEALRRSGLDYTVLRAGLLTNDPPGRRGILITQEARPLAFSGRVSRADVAEVFVQALRHPAARRATFNVVGVPRAEPLDWGAIFGSLRADP